jgi:anti-sigma-K factor RskA
MSAPDEPDDDRALAAEYALGLLEPAEARAFEARLAAEPDLRALHAAWEEDLAALAGEVPEAAPPAEARRGIEARLFPEARQPFWRRARLLQYALGGAAAAALAWAALTWDILQPEPALRAEIAAEDGALRLSASVDGGTGALRVVREAGAPPPGRVLELWLIAGDAAPVSLGVLEAREVAVTLPAALRDALPGAVLAVSEEPPGGSPTGAPTGEVLATGQVVEAG